MNPIQLFRSAERHTDRTAIIDDSGRFTYGRLIEASASVSAALLEGVRDLREKRIGFMAPPGFDYVAAQWGIWRAGGVAVPMGSRHPIPELEYIVDDAQVAGLVTHPDFAGMLQPIAQARRLPLHLIQEALTVDPVALPLLDNKRRAMILYTSGTTSRPKGVVTTHANIHAQITSLTDAWEWKADDHVLNVLPLHHIHAIINVLSCALMAGAQCEFLPRFAAETAWDRIVRGDLTLFMAVPTVYAKLISAWESDTAVRRNAMSQGCRRMRLMISGSAALPVTTLDRWKTISGHVLLERYGMTEIGMALSNPLRGKRVPGHVGTPLPEMEVRRVDETGRPVQPEVPGEIEVRGPSVFLEYWNQPDATKAAFRAGWFRTGDVALAEGGVYRILGRTSVDIIKTGGYKVSALEIEETLRMHPAIRECAVVGMEDPEWGERVSACVVLNADRRLTLESLRHWAKERLAVYKVPSRLLIAEELPRNAMGKVRKPAVSARFKDQLNCT